MKPTKLDLFCWITAALLTVAFCAVCVWACVRAIEGKIPNYSEYDYCPQLVQQK